MYLSWYHNARHALGSALGRKQATGLWQLWVEADTSILDAAFQSHHRSATPALQLLAGGTMATVAVAPTPPREQEPFPVNRAADGNFFLLYVALIWLAVLAGFGPEMIRRLNSNSAPFPIAVHVHAIITVAWLGLLISQTLLIGKRELRLHRKWGVAGAILAVAVIAVGLWAAFAFEKLAMNTPERRPH